MKEYDIVGDYYGSFARVKLNNKYGFIDINGDEICDIKYDFVHYFYDSYAIVICCVNNYSFYGIINDQGFEIIECKYTITEIPKILEIYKLNQKRISKLKNIV